MEDYTFSPEEIEEFKALANRFARQTIRPFLNSEFSDGDLSQTEGIISAGRQAGLWADGENSLGIWGTDHTGASLSMEMLAALSSSCAGVALLFHSNGLARRIFADGGGLTGLPVLCALQDKEGPPSAGHFSPAGSFKEEKAESPLSRLFVPVPIKSDALFTFIRRESRITMVLFEINHDGIKEERIEERLGLRACPLYHFHITRNVPQTVVNEEAREIMRKSWYMQWLGLSAMAVGTARGALQAAREYCGQRYQGGTIIRDHDAIRTLLVNAQSALFTAESLLHRSWPLSKITTGLLAQAAMTKLSVMELCASAVTDSLQTFGGYGYMEDFGMEKRLRDIHTLKTMSGGPLYLRRLIANLNEES